MKPLRAEDVANLHEYELERPDFRARLIALKKRRRVAMTVITSITPMRITTGKATPMGMMRPPGGTAIPCSWQ